MLRHMHGADRLSALFDSRSDDGAAVRALSSVSARPADDALVLEFLDDAGHVELVFGDARVPGVVRAPPAWLVEGAVHEVAVLVGEEPIGVDVRVVAGAAVQAGQVARVCFLGLEIAGRPLRAATPAPGLTGRLEDVPLVEIVQLVCASRRDAVIELAGGVGGVVACAGGRVVYARCEDGTGGDEAFFALAVGRRGSFAVEYGRGVVAANVHADTTWLALEAMRRQDEAEGRVASAPTVSTSTASLDPFASLPPSPAVVVAASAEAAAVADDDRPATPTASRPPTSPERAGATAVPPPRPRGRPSPAVPLVPITSSSPSTSTSPPSPRPLPRPSGMPLPAQVQGRFSRFFEELTEALRSDALAAPPRAAGAATQAVVRPVALEARVEIDLDLDLEVDEVVDLDDELDAELDEDTTARLRFTSLRVPVPAGEDEAPTDIVRRPGSLSA
jgi:hypothetical protein